ncbi:MAG: twin-arginine translocase TatA/TatE family subunit [Ilumatobacter sp.]|nr:MAG: twin-arginine translocase TatA/TatE family subunit [Ilumatobacter sp.]
MIQGPQLIIVLAIVLLLFGGSKLPKLARSLGQAQKEFRDGLKEGQDDDDAPVQAANASAVTPPPAVEAPKPAPAPADPVQSDQPAVDRDSTSRSDS